MFGLGKYKKRMACLEERVERLTGVINMLARDLSIVMLDSEEYIAMLTDEDSVETMTRNDAAYKKRLSKFIRTHRIRK